jgi:hypothetical protein
MPEIAAPYDAGLAVLSTFEPAAMALAWLSSWPTSIGSSVGMTNSGTCSAMKSCGSFPRFFHQQVRKIDLVCR